MSLTQEILTKCFSIEHYEIVKVDKFSGQLKLHLERVDESLCPHCQQAAKRYDSTEQQFAIGSLNGCGVYAAVKIYRVHCAYHGVVTEAHGLSEGKQRYSKTLGQVVTRFSEKLDNQAASELLGLSASTVYRIDYAELESALTRYQEAAPEVKQLSVDEISYKRRHHYASVISDYQGGKVLWLEKGRSEADISRGYTVLSASLKQVDTVTMDFWKPFENATRKHLPKATILYDRFHIARLLNRAIETERRAYQKELPDEQRRQIKRHSRWVLLKRQGNLTDKNQQHLEDLKQMNERLFELYLLKESFLSIFDDYVTVKEARQKLFAWIRQVMQLEFTGLKRFAKSILKRLRAILHWFNKPISNAKAEGINNVIRTLLKRGYGYKNFDYFRMKVLQKCGYLMNYVTHTF